MPDIIVYGAGGHAKVVIDAIEQGGGHADIQVVDDRPELHGQAFFGYPVIGGRAALLGRPAPHPEVIAAIGDNAARLAVSAWLREQGYPLAAVVHPTVCLGRGSVVGAGSFLAAGVVVNPDSVLGEAVIVNTGATVDHDCLLADGVHVAPGCHLCGNVSVGRGSLIGVGAVVIPGVRIGADVVVGAGAVVRADVPDGARVAGVPARPIG